MLAVESGWRRCDGKVCGLQDLGKLSKVFPREQLERGMRGIVIVFSVHRGALIGPD